MARQIVTRANQSIAEFGPILQGALGMDGGVDTRQDQAPTWPSACRCKRPRPRRSGPRLREAIAFKKYEFDAHGVEMNQRYHSNAIVTDGQTEPAFDRDPELFAQLTTWPGSRLPHAWLFPRAGGKISTLDLCGRGRFTLLTSIGGDAWELAAERVSDDLGVPLVTHVIGPRCPIDDPVGDWARLSEVTDSGLILVRPDHHVCWRVASLPADPHAELLRAMRQILARN